MERADRRRPSISAAGLVVLAAVLAAFPSAPMAAANLVVNPGFDDDIAGWSSLSTIQRSDADELGSPLSGSLEITALDADQTSVNAYQCVPVVEGTTYVMGAAARLQPSSNAAFVDVTWFDTAGCSGSGIDTEEPLPYFVRLEGVWGTTQRWSTAPVGASSALLRLKANTGAHRPGLFRVEFDNAFFLADATCANSPTTLCLSQGRFRVIAEWETQQGAKGFGKAVTLTGDSGYFWFFDDANVELVTKLLDACPTQFDRFWFFAAGLTNVETVIRVHDTEADVDRVYTNPLDTPFAPIQDTAAFDTCP